MSFHEQSFQSRFGTMGDQAEAAFDQVFPKNHKLGLNRPPFSMSGMLLEMRYVPDRITRDAFVEVMGIGTDQTLKLKIEKFDALFAWKSIGPVDLFVYDSKHDRWWLAPITDWFRAVLLHGTLDQFHDGKEYAALHADHFPSLPTPLQQTEVA